jgi:protease PrsW
MDLSNLKIAAAIAPALALMWYLDKLDAKRPEPRNVLHRATWVGALSVIPAAILEYVLQHVVETKHLLTELWMAPIFMGCMAGFVEELGKAVGMRAFIMGRPEFDERLDGIVYAARVGLGFAAVENVFYLLAQNTFEGFVTVAVLRAILAVPGHAIWAAIMGYAAARARFDHRGIGIVGGFLIAAILHSAYDVAIFTAVIYPQSKFVPLLYATPVAIIVIGAIAVRLLARSALRDDDLQHGQMPTNLPIST